MRTLLMSVIAAAVLTAQAQLLAEEGPSATAEVERAQITRIVDMAAVADKKMPIELFDTIAKVIGVPAYETGASPPFGKVQKLDNELQRVLVIRKRADGTRDVIFMRTPAADATYYYRIDSSGKLIEGTYALRGSLRPLTDSERLGLNDELAYWKKWAEDMNRARLAPKGVPAKPEK